MKRLIPLLLLCFLASCGARNTHKSNLDIAIKSSSEFATNDTTNVKTTSEANTRITTTVAKEAGTGAVIETTTVEPIDNTKPASVVDEQGKKTELNNAKQTKQKKTLQRDEKSTTVSNIQTNEKAAQVSVKRVQTSGKASIESQTNESSKTTDKKEPFNYLWILALFVVIFIGRCIYCIKKKIPLL